MALSDKISNAMDAICIWANAAPFRINHATGGWHDRPYMTPPENTLILFDTQAKGFRFMRKMITGLSHGAFVPAVDIVGYFALEPLPHGSGEYHVARLVPSKTIIVGHQDAHGIRVDFEGRNGYVTLFMRDRDDDSYYWEFIVDVLAEIKKSEVRGRMILKNEKYKHIEQLLEKKPMAWGTHFDHL